MQAEGKIPVTRMALDIWNFRLGTRRPKPPRNTGDTPPDQAPIVAARPVFRPAAKARPAKATASDAIPEPGSGAGAP